MARMYTEALERQRNTLSKRTIDEVEQAILSGDMEKALELHRKNVVNKTNFHHFAVRWVNQTISSLKRHLPDETIYDCMKDYARTFYPPVITEWINGHKKGTLTYKDFPVEAFLDNRSILWQSVHDNGDQIWEEDEDKITFTLSRCNSGGWLTGECPDPIAGTDEGHFWCYGRKNFQCYCLNCTTMWEFGWYEWFGWPLFIMTVPEIGGDGRCVMVMYKDPKQIPDAYYERHGLQRKI